MVHVATLHGSPWKETGRKDQGARRFGTGPERHHSEGVPVTPRLGPEATVPCGQPWEELHVGRAVWSLRGAERREGLPLRQGGGKEPETGPTVD